MPRAGLFAPVLVKFPTSPTGQRPPSGYLGADPLLQHLSELKVLPEPEALLFLTHHTLWLWQLPQFGQVEDPISTFVELVSRLLLSNLSIADVNLLEEEIGWERLVGGGIRPAKAMVLRVAAVCLPPCPQLPPQPTTCHYSSGTYCG